MNVVDIVVIVAVSLAVLGVVGWIIYRKVKGKKIGCDCDCSSCGGCGKKK
ncbi:MAG: FeoB-associated Cys-rich membrane protein [Clostridia bacterium]|jgi:hypothetical protein|nr:FeoB-associated Cys-rich membrane protein [Clostridia bacterium]